MKNVNRPSSLTKRSLSQSKTYKLSSKIGNRVCERKESQDRVRAEQQKSCANKLHQAFILQMKKKAVKKGYVTYMKINKS